MSAAIRLIPISTLIEKSRWNVRDAEPMNEFAEEILRREGWVDGVLNNDAAIAAQDKP